MSQKRAASTKGKAKRRTTPKTRAHKDTRIAYSEALAANICYEIAHGASMRKACDRCGISDRAVHEWLAQHTEFAQRYARAREAQADHLFDQIVEIADDNSQDLVPVINMKGEATGEWRENHDTARRAQIKIDARKWIASKLAPKKYGDKMQIDANLNVGLRDMTDEALADNLRSMIEKLQAAGVAVLPAKKG